MMKCAYMYVDDHKKSVCLKIKDVDDERRGSKNGKN